MNPHVKPMEKETTRKTTKNPSPPQTFSSLPHEIAESCLARIPRSYYPKLSTVSKSFRSFLSSRELYAARARLGNTEQCLYICLWDCSLHIPQWFTLLSNPNLIITEKKKETTAQLLVPIPSSDFSSVRGAAVAVGSEIYVIGKDPSSSMSVLHCCNHTWRDAPSMNVARSNMTAGVYQRKIYVMGGVQGGESFGEVFDTKTQTWERLPDPPIAIADSCFINFVEIEGKIYVWDFEIDYAYDLKQGKWECCSACIETILNEEHVIENVSYCYGDIFSGRSRLCWFDIKDGNWKDVKGIDTLKVYRKNVKDYVRPKLVSFGGKLLAIWEEYTSDTAIIWCAEIVVEKRDGGEVWGEIKWVDVVYSSPFRWSLLHCVAISL